MSTAQDNPAATPATAGGRVTKTLARHITAPDGWAIFCPDTAPAFAGNAQPGRRLVLPRMRYRACRGRV